MTPIEQWLETAVFRHLAIINSISMPFGCILHFGHFNIYLIDNFPVVRSLCSCSLFQYLMCHSLSSRKYFDQNSVRLRKGFKVPEKFAGQWGRCPKCGTIITVHNLSEEILTFAETRLENAAIMPKSCLKKSLNAAQTPLQQANACSLAGNYYLKLDRLFKR